MKTTLTLKLITLTLLFSSAAPAHAVNAQDCQRQIQGQLPPGVQIVGGAAAAATSIVFAVAACPATGCASVALGGMGVMAGIDNISRGLRNLMRGKNACAGVSVTIVPTQR